MKTESNKYQHHIFVCLNERTSSDPRGCCKTKGSEEVRLRFAKEIEARGLKGKIRANKAGCLDNCANGISAVVYPSGAWYSQVTIDDVPRILDETLKG